jgi:hypothetical protein
MSNGQVITLSNFPFDFDTIFYEYFNNHQVLETKLGYESEQDLILLEFLIDNIFVNFGGRVFQQTVGYKL